MSFGIDATMIGELEGKIDSYARIIEDVEFSGVYCSIIYAHGVCVEIRDVKSPDPMMSFCLNDFRLCDYPFYSYSNLSKIPN